MLKLLLNLTFSLSVMAQTVSIWTSSENVKKAIEGQSLKFEKSFGVKVKIDVLNKDLTTQFKTAAMTGKGPDILCWAHDVVGELAESGIIAPLDLSDQFKSNFLPAAIKAYTYKNSIYGYPYDIESVALIYNKDLVSSPPQTMEELIAFAKKFNKHNPEKSAFLYDIKSFFFSFPIIASNGAYIFKQEDSGLNARDLGLANEGAIKAVSFLNKVINDGIIPASTDRSIAFNKMKEGKLAMTIDGPWAIEELKKAKINYGIAKIPSYLNNAAKPFVGSHGFFIRRSSKNIDLAKELIEKYLVSKEGIIALYKEDPRGPSRADSLNELSKDNEDLVSFFNSAKDGIPMPNIPQMGAVWGAMGSALNLIFHNREGVKEALEIAVNQIKNSTMSK
jgi:maltose/maltodextrin transport system substrate-binding protein